MYNDFLRLIKEPIWVVSKLYRQDEQHDVVAEGDVPNDWVAPLVYDEAPHAFPPTESI